MNEDIDDCKGNVQILSRCCNVKKWCEWENRFLFPISSHLHSKHAQPAMREKLCPFSPIYQLPELDKCIACIALQQASGRRLSLIVLHSFQRFPVLLLIFHQRKSQRILPILLLTMVCDATFNYHLLPDAMSCGSKWHSGGQKSLCDVGACF